jgi:hypothetical protein
MKIPLSDDSESVRLRLFLSFDDDTANDDKSSTELALLSFLNIPLLPSLGLPKDYTTC